jgi:hypothetical protein
MALKTPLAAQRKPNEYSAAGDIKKKRLDQMNDSTGKVSST